MSRFISLLLLLLCPLAARAANLASGEWFIDSDPGRGAGTAFALPAEPDASASVTIPAAVLNVLEPGFHLLGVRVLDGDDEWGHVVWRAFHKDTELEIPRLLAGAEWFIDEDPGVGQGTAFALPEAQAGSALPQIPASVLNQLSDGYHLLGVRTRDNLSHWGPVLWRGFHIDRSPEIPPHIVSVEYQIFRDGLEVFQATAEAAPPGATVDLTVNHGTANLSLDAGHLLQVVPLDAQGRRGHAAYADFTVQDTASLPSVTTAAASSVTANSASTGGSVAGDGGTSVTERGVVYGTTPNPDTATGTQVPAGAGLGDFICQLTGLNAGATYYVRAYAINSEGTAYGEQIQFTTQAGGTEPPDWQPSAGKEFSMTVYAQVEKDGQRIDAAGSLLAVFEDGAVAGVALPINGPAGWLYQLTIWSNQVTAGNLPLRVYDAASGQIHDIKERVSFTANGVQGQINAPQLFTVQPPVVEQDIPLVSGWNWLSFNSLPNLPTVTETLAAYTPQNNDLIKGVAGSATYYGGSWFPADFAIEPGKMYQLRRQQAGPATLSVTGPPAASTQALSLVAGWNWLGYIPQEARAIGASLQGLTLADNDLLKSQQNGTVTFFGGQWFPDSMLMQAGRGYLLRLSQAQTFHYDEPSSGEALAESQNAPDTETLPQALLAAESGEAPDWQQPTGKENSMTLYARVQVNGQPVVAAGSLLAVFEGSAVAGVAEVMDGPAGKLFQVTVWSNAVSVPGLALKVYDAATSLQHDLLETLDFTANGITGQITDPQLFTATAGTGLVVNPASQSVAPAGGSHSFSVTASADWSWSKSAGSSWLTTGEAVTQNGNQIFSYTVAANTGSSVRSATFTLTSGELVATHTVTQNGSGGTTGERRTLTLTRIVPATLAATPDKAGVLAFKAAPAKNAGKLSKGPAPQTNLVLPGTLVTVTATAKSGHLFEQWSGLPAGAQVTGNTVSFIMPGADVPDLTAGFISNPLLAANADNPFFGLGSKPVFQGLLRPDSETAASNATVGHLSATVVAGKGSFSGKVLMDGQSTSCSGVLQGDGSVWFRIGKTLTASLPLKDGAATGKTLSAIWSEDGLQAAVSRVGGETSEGLAQPAIYRNAPGFDAPMDLLNRSNGKQGYFTLALPAEGQAPPQDASTYPQGAGYATLTLAKTGGLKLAGVLADGTRITASSFLVEGDASPVFIQLRTPGGKASDKGGSLSGELVFDPSAADSDVGGEDWLWFRPAAKTKLTSAQAYRSGWPQGITLDPVGALYDAALPAQEALGLADADTVSGNALLAFSGVKLDAEIEITNFNISGSKVVKIPAKDKSFSLSITSKTGLMKGAFAPEWTAPLNSAKKPPAFQGVLLQKGGNAGGWGFFLSNAAGDLAPESGAVSLGNP